nr:hypothetical protein [Tanacetum cinerariifolium]
SGDGWKRYEDGGESPENMVESGGGDGGLKGCLDHWLTISSNVEVLFDLPNVDVLDGGYLDLTLSSPLLKI